MKTYKIATSILSLTITLLFAFANPANAQRKDFSGHWLRNEEKSDYGTLAKAYYPNGDLWITQENAMLLLKMETGTTKLAFDGREDQSEVNGNGGPRTKKSSLKWLSDRSFLITVSYTGSLTYGMTRIFTINEDGKTLTEKSHTDYKPLNTVYDATFIYNKQ